MELVGQRMEKLDLNQGLIITKMPHLAKAIQNDSFD
jgi:hypothetical protein